MKRLERALIALLLVLCLLLCGCSQLVDIAAEVVESALTEQQDTYYDIIPEEADNAPGLDLSAFGLGSDSDLGSAAAPTATPKPTKTPKATAAPTQEPDTDKPDKNGVYTSMEDVEAYIIAYGCLPDNFITKKEAQALGWTGGSLEPYAPGKSIGGDHFGNYEKLLPTAKGRKYTECDIDTKGKKSRGSKRIVFSNDGLIYYTADHYESFTLIYGG